MTRCGASRATPRPARRARTGSTSGRREPAFSCSRCLSFLVLGQIGRGQSGGGLLVEHPDEQRREAGRGLDVGWLGRGRSVGYGRERGAETAGVLGLVLG